MRSIVLGTHVSGGASRSRFFPRICFDREARAISSLSHPNIRHLYDMGQQDGATYLIMVHLDGRDAGG